MRQLTAFTKKEFIESARTGKMLILMILFILFGIMNPAIAKLTPWLMEIMSQSLSDAGFSLTQTEVNALTSWTQFYKNIPLACIIFLLMFSNTLTAEYQNGTLINMMTKGLDRWKIIVSKILTVTALWTLGYWICYGITYGYNAFFWDNHIAAHLLFSAFCFYLFGVWMISLIILMSSFLRSSSAVLIAAGGVFLIIYLSGLLPDVKKYLPAQLLNSSGLLAGMNMVSEYLPAVIVTIALSILNMAAAIIIFRYQEI